MSDIPTLPSSSAEVPAEVLTPQRYAYQEYWRAQKVRSQRELNAIEPQLALMEKHGIHKDLDSTRPGSKAKVERYEKLCDHAAELRVEIADYEEKLERPQPISTARMSGGDVAGDRAKHQGLRDKIGEVPFLILYSLEVKRIQRSRAHQEKLGLTHRATHREWKRLLYSRLRMRIHLILKDRARRQANLSSALDRRAGPSDVADEEAEAVREVQDSEMSVARSSQWVEPTREARLDDPDRRRARNQRKRANKKARNIAAKAKAEASVAELEAEWQLQEESQEAAQEGSFEGRLWNDRKKPRWATGALSLSEDEDVQFVQQPAEAPVGEEPEAEGEGGESEGPPSGQEAGGEVDANLLGDPAVALIPHPSDDSVSVTEHLTKGKDETLDEAEVLLGENVPVDGATPGWWQSAENPLGGQFSHVWNWFPEITIPRGTFRRRERLFRTIGRTVTSCLRKSSMLGGQPLSPKFPFGSLKDETRE